MLGKQVYISNKDIKAIELLESIFDACVGNGEEYSDEERELIQGLFDKMMGVRSSNVAYKIAK